MERVGILIDKLKEQFVQQAETDSLLVTVQMLMAELHQSKSGQISRGGISVVMPSAPVLQEQVIPMFDSPVAKTVAKSNGQRKEDLTGWLFDMNAETVNAEAGNNKLVLELNDTIVEDLKSLNDHLKTDNTDVSDSFQETPIRDLKKAIGINDRYLFINELFRGDETMYERSLKTINGFNIFPEAQYWIQRELKVKLGWNERSEIVDHFDQLVKRRFA